MAEDVFDIVNDHDEVIGHAPRSEVHKKKLNHRAAHVLIFSPDGGKILLQKRSMQKDLCPGLWTTSCSGHVDSGESYETGVLRELHEETGLRRRIEDLKFVGKISPCEATGREFTAVYTLEIPEKENLFFQPEEIDSFSWTDILVFEEMIKNSPLQFTPSFIKVYEFYLSKIS